MDKTNWALWIAIQCGVSSLIWGGTGAAKTAYCLALGRFLKRNPFLIIPSQHDSADIGGIPDIDKKAGSLKTYYLDFLKELTEPNGMLIIDELTTAPQSMRPPLLSILNEGVVGSLRFHPTTIRVAIANPPELAPNSSPLEPSMLNRLYHHQWELPFESWYNGMMNGGKFTINPSSFPLVGDTSAYLPKWTRMIGRLVKLKPSLREGKPSEDEHGFCSLRQWHALSLALAGANQVGADGDVYSKLASGMIGSAGAGQLTAYLGANDIYDPAKVIDGTEIVDYTDGIDRLVCLPVGILNALAPEKEEDNARIARAVAALVSMSENGLFDCVGPVITDIRKCYPKYKMSSTLLARYGTVVGKVQGV